MFGFDPISLTSLIILAGNTITCPSHPSTKINIIPHTEKVKYDYKQSLKQIQKYETDTVDPYGFHGSTITQGFMSSGVTLKHSIQFGKLINEKYGYSCVWYKDITVDIKIAPTIVIASELYKDRCMRNAILGHELKHVRVDREVVNKYAKSMGRKLLKELKSRGFSVGPIRIDASKNVTKKMQRVVGQILELEYRKLGIDREEKQRAVDNLNEYNRVDEKCPSFKDKKKKLYADLLQ